jgi:hypothetical protein
MTSLGQWYGFRERASSCLDILQEKEKEKNKKTTVCETT